MAPDQASDSLQQFLAAPPRVRLRMAAEPAHAALLTRHLGADGFAAYARLSATVGPSHLAFDSPPNVVFIPGIMGSLLMSHGLQGVWWIDVRTRDHLDHLALSPDGLRDIDPGFKVAPFCVDPSYEGFFAAALATDDIGVLPFPYDWRKPLSASAAGLREAIRKAYSDNGERRVHVVAHSMGGLIARTTLRAYPDLWDLVERVIFIATPHYGSAAIASYLKNHLWGFNLMAVLGTYLSRDTFRSLWGALALLPAPLGVYPGTRGGGETPWSSGNRSDPYMHPCANFNLYDADAWELDLPSEKRDCLQAVLDGAALSHRELHSWHEGLDQSLRDRMTIIAGVGYQTLFRLERRRALGFLWKETEKVTSVRPGDNHRDGDGRVSIASAKLDNVEIRYVHGEHGGLPTIPAVYHDVFASIRGKDMELFDTPAGAMVEHLAPVDSTPVASALGPLPGPRNDDPGYLDTSDPDPVTLDTLQKQLAQDSLPEFRRIRIL